MTNVDSRNVSEVILWTFKFQRVSLFVYSFFLKKCYFCFIFNVNMQFLNTLNETTAKENKHKTLHKLNFKIKITICLHKNFRKVRLKRKANQESKQTNETNSKYHHQKKWYPPNQTRFSKRFFTSFYLKNPSSKNEPSMLWNNVIYNVPFLCKSNGFLWIS